MNDNKYVKFVIYNHKEILFIIFCIVIASFLINIFIPQNTVFFIGEYIYSFDYLGHISNILDDYRNSGFTIDDTNCDDCPDFYHYSRWYSLVKIGYLSIGQLLHLNAFVFLVSSMICLLLIGLYIFSHSYFKNFQLIPFIIAAYFYIFYPYRFSLFVETHDGTIHSSILILASFFIILLSNFNKFNFKQIIVYSVMSGFFFSLFLNINIGYLPILLYLALIYSVFFLKYVTKSFKKIVIFVISFTIPIIILNIPVLYSLIRSGNSRHYENYFSFGLIDSFTSGLSLAQTDFHVLVIICILFILSLVLSTLTIKQRFYLTALYLFFGILLLGKNSPINIYGWLFNNLPLGDSLRSTYRLFFFQLVIIFIVIYHLLNWFYLRKEKASKIAFLIIISVVILVPALHIKQHSNYILKLELPNEYFIAQKYLNNLPGKKIYYPYGVNGVINLSNSYTWSNPDYAESIVIYKNPFTSLLPIRNIVQFEKYPLLSSQLLELRNLTDMQKTAKYVVEALSLRNIDYLIYDNNYLWDSIQSRIKLADLLKEINLYKKIGNLYVFKIPKSKQICNSAYGDFRINSCFSVKNPKSLISRSKLDYILEEYSIQNSMKLPISTSSNYFRNILDPYLHRVLLDNNIFISNKMLQIESNQTNVFVRNHLKEGQYLLYLPILQINPIHSKLGLGNILIRINNILVRDIESYGQCSGVKWLEVPINILKDDSSFSIDIQDNGYIILNSNPIFLTLIQDKKLNKMAEDLKIVNKDSLVNIKINNNLIKLPNKCNSLEVDLYKYLFDSSRNFVDELSSVSKSDYFIEISQKISDLKISVDSSLHGSDHLLGVSIMKNDKTISRVEGVWDNYHTNFYFSDEVLRKVGNSFTIILETSNNTQINHVYMQAIIVQ